MTLSYVMKKVIGEDQELFSTRLNSEMHGETKTSDTAVQPTYTTSVQDENPTKILEDRVSFRGCLCNQCRTKKTAES